MGLDLGQSLPDVFEILAARLRLILELALALAKRVDRAVFRIDFLLDEVTLL